MHHPQINLTYKASTYITQDASPHCAIIVCNRRSGGLEGIQFIACHDGTTGAMHLKLSSSLRILFGGGVCEIIWMFWKSILSAGACF